MSEVSEANLPERKYSLSSLEKVALEYDKIEMNKALDQLKKSLNYMAIRAAYGTQGYNVYSNRY
ncbi:hypothetical protein KW805_04075 [Candidatus Pacearchaeota archaeon]|nr:hypothetical protein [Candidatus Pacearchaeota archaeon]